MYIMFTLFDGPLLFDQGPVLGVLHAIEAFQKCGKEIPINLKVSAIQLYVGGFLRVLWFPAPVKLALHHHFTTSCKARNKRFAKLRITFKKTQFPPTFELRRRSPAKLVPGPLAWGLGRCCQSHLYCQSWEPASPTSFINLSSVSESVTVMNKQHCDITEYASNRIKKDGPPLANFNNQESVKMFFSTPRRPDGEKV